MTPLCHDLRWSEDPSRGVTRHTTLRGWSLIRLLVITFLFIGSVYPVLRIELMERTGLSSSLLGAWQDLIALLLLGMLLLQHRMIQLQRTLPELAMAGILICGAISGATAIFSGIGFMTIAYGIRLTYVPMIYYFAGRSFRITVDDVAAMHRSLVGLLVFSAMTGLLFSYVIPAYWFRIVIASDERGWGLFTISRVGSFRMTGAALDPVTFGTLCAWGVVLSLTGLRASRTPGNRFLMILGIATCSIGAIMSLTRGAWLALFLGVLVSLLLSAKRLKTIVSLGLAGAAAVVGLNFLPGENSASAILSQTLEKTVREGNDQRDEMWDQAGASLFDKPLGYGLGAVGHVGERFRDEVPSDAPIITDGWYHKLLAEGGVPLLVTFVLFLSTTLLRLFVLSRQRSPPTALTAFRIAGLAILATTVVQALVSNLWDLFYLSQLVWFITGLASRTDVETSRNSL